MRLCRAWVLLLIAWVGSGPITAFGATPDRIDRRMDFSAPYSESIDLDTGDLVEISAGVESPSQLPENGRVAVEWNAPVENAGFRKVLHALDPDVYVLYRAPQQGRYTISIRPVEDEEPPAETPRWRETGILADMRPFPKHTPWPAGQKTSVRVSLRNVDFGPATRGVIVETEPNNSLRQAQVNSLCAG